MIQTIYILIALIHTTTWDVTQVAQEHMAFNSLKECNDELAHMRPIMDKYVTDGVTVDMRCIAFDIRTGQ
jgi:hypothetical protein